jgi:hypothetical protein
MKFIQLKKQAWNRQHAIESALGRELKYVQLKGYGVYSTVRNDQIPEDRRVINPKKV